MQRVQVLRSSASNISLAGVEYPVENGHINVHPLHAKEAEKYPHIYKIVGPEQVVVPANGLNEPGEDEPKPKGLKPYVPPVKAK